MNDDLLDRRLTRLAHAARAEAAERAAQLDTDRALADVVAGRTNTGLTPHDPRPPRRWLPLAAIAAASATILGGGIVLFSGDDNRIQTNDPPSTIDPPPTVTPAPSASTDPEDPTETAPATTALPAAPVPETTAVPDSATETAPATTAVPPTSAPPTSAPSTTTPAATEPNPVLDGIVWEASGIGRACEDRNVCTLVVRDPSGVPVSLDPTDGTLTRHARTADDEVTASIADRYQGAWLVAAGPDDVVYLGVDNFPESSDLVALSMAPGDAGREIARLTEAVPIGDSDLVATPNGIVMTGWYGQGPRPPADAEIITPWLDQSGEPTTSTDMRDVRIDAFEPTITVDGREWSLADLPIQIEPIGMPLVEATFDGGFIATYQETSTVGLRAVVNRGWPDGSVEQWEMPGSWFEHGPPIPEPTGTVLIPNGERFARAMPFEQRPSGWDGNLEVDFESGTATAPGLNEYLDANDPTWESDRVAMANVIAGPTAPAQRRSIRLLGTTAPTFDVEVTTERYLDDSVFGTRLLIRFSQQGDGTWRVQEIAWSNACQPGRGHQTYAAALCT